MVNDRDGGTGAGRRLHPRVLAKVEEGRRQVRAGEELVDLDELG